MSTDKGVAVNAGAGTVTLIPRGITDVELCIAAPEGRISCYLRPENARHLQEFIAAWLDRFDVGEGK